MRSSSVHLFGILSSLTINEFDFLFLYSERIFYLMTWRRSKLTTGTAGG